MLKTTIKNTAVLKGKINGGGALSASIHQGTNNPYEEYTGEYTVTPQVERQVLKTKNKYLTDDVTVEKIPCAVVSNTAGGNTVYIAKEI